MALLAVLAVAAVVARGEPAPEPTLSVSRPREASPRPGTAPVALPGTGSWTGIPRPPASFTAEPARVWTGRELLVVGSDGDRLVGAAFDPARRVWRAMEPPPLSDRLDPVVEWLPAPPESTGGALVVWGGRARATGSWRSDGATYDPGADRWRPLAASFPGRARAASTVTESGVLVLGGVAADGSPLRDGALLVDEGDGFAWEAVPALPEDSVPLAGLVWTGRMAIALTERAPGSERVRVHGWRPGLGGWRPHPPVHVPRAGRIAAAASDGVVALWTDGGWDRGQLELYDVWERRWDSVPAPLPKTGRPAVSWIDGRVAVWTGPAAPDGEGRFTRGALYDPERGRWASLDPRAGGGQWWSAPPVWTGNQLVVLGALAAWRPGGFPPLLAEDTGAVLYLTTRDRLLTVDVDERAVSRRRVPVAPRPPGLLLRDGWLVTVGRGRTLAVPTAGGTPREIDATMVLPAGDDAVWLLHEGMAWTAVKARGDGTARSEPMPLPDGASPIAGLAEHLIVRTADGSQRLWNPFTRSATAPVPSFWIATGTHRAAYCSPATPPDAGMGWLGACGAVTLLDAATGSTREVAAEGLAFGMSSVAFAPGDGALAMVAWRGDEPVIAIISALDGRPRVAVAEPNGRPSDAVAWHPDGRWVFAAVDGRLVAVDVATAEVFDAGVELPDLVTGMVAGNAGPARPPVHEARTGGTARHMVRGLPGRGGGIR